MECLGNGFPEDNIGALLWWRMFVKGKETLYIYIIGKKALYVNLDKYFLSRNGGSR